MKDQNAFHMAYVTPLPRLEPMEYVYPEFSDATAYSQSKHAIMSASEYIEAVYRGVRMFK